MRNVTRPTAPTTAAPMTEPVALDARFRLGELGRRRQTVHFGLVDQQVERVESAQRTVAIGAVELAPRFTLRLQLTRLALRPLTQLIDGTELDRIGGARLRARRLEADAHAVVAERALLRRARDRGSCR